MRWESAATLNRVAGEGCRPTRSGGGGERNGAQSQTGDDDRGRGPRARARPAVSFPARRGRGDRARRRRQHAGGRSDLRRHNLPWSLGGRRQDRSAGRADDLAGPVERSEEHTSELQSLMRISYAVFCLKKKKKTAKHTKT